MILWANWSEYLGEQTKINYLSVPLLILSIVRHDHSMNDPKHYSKFDHFKNYESWLWVNFNNGHIEIINACEHVQLFAMLNDRQSHPINSLLLEHDPRFSCAGRWWSEGRPCEARRGPASAASKASHRWISTSGWLREQKGHSDNKENQIFLIYKEI